MTRMGDDQGRIAPVGDSILDPEVVVDAGGIPNASSPRGALVPGSLRAGEDSTDPTAPEDLAEVASRSKVMLGSFVRRVVSNYVCCRHGCR